MSSHINHINQEGCCAVVLGGYVNGFSVVRELYACGVSNIHVIDNKRSIATFSNKVNGYLIAERTAADLLTAINELRSKFDRIVFFPTDDLHLEHLQEIQGEFAVDTGCGVCHMPFNETSLIKHLDKSMQYKVAASVSVPFPASVDLGSDSQLDQLGVLKFPIIIKPTTRCDISGEGFRNLYLESDRELAKHSAILRQSLNSGAALIASEFVPGDDTNIYAYTAYRSKQGVILNEWIGKKLTQYPNEYGVFSSASNDCPEVVRDQGRRLLDALDVHGIAEPEFKFDSRTGEYKLMEVNLRPMMWHRLGHLTGVSLMYSQWLDSLGQSVPKYQQKFDERVHFVYGKHELLNLAFRRKYFQHFVKNVFRSDRTEFAVFDRHDIKPFLVDLYRTILSFGARCLR